MEPGEGGDLYLDEYLSDIDLPGPGTLLKAGGVWRMHGGGWVLSPRSGEDLIE